MLYWEKHHPEYGYHVFKGKIGNVTIFKIQRVMSKQSWGLTCFLPGVKPKLGFGEPDALKARADKALAHWLQLARLQEAASDE